MQFSGRVLGDEHKSPPPWIKRLAAKREGVFMPTVGVMKRWIMRFSLLGRNGGWGWLEVRAVVGGTVWAKRWAEGVDM